MPRLVITRHEGDAINIGPDIRVTINRIGNRKVRVAIEAPRELKVLRSELVPESRDGAVAAHDARG